MKTNRHEKGTVVAGTSMGGKFSTQNRTEADGVQLSLALEVPDITPEVARSPEFSEMVIINRFKLALDDPSLVMTSRADGSCELRFTQPGHYPFATVVSLNTNGDVTQASVLHSTGQRNSPETKNDLQHQVRMERLRAMGVEVNDSENDGGNYDHRFTGGRRMELGSGYPDATEVSRLTRQDLKRAVVYGVLPDDIKVKVRTDKYSMGQAVLIDARLPAGRVDSGLKPGEGYRHTPEARSIRQAIEAIGDQWNDRESNPMADYSDCSYHLMVTLGEQD